MRYDRGSGACKGQTEGGDSDAVFLVESGATLQYVLHYGRHARISADSRFRLGMSSSVPTRLRVFTASALAISTMVGLSDTPYQLIYSQCLCS